jgi:hypothetical protein
VSPRKSSTSSGRRSDAPRPRYLGVEVAGELFPPPSPRGWETWLRGRLGPDAGAVRVIRSDGPRAIAEVGHRHLAAARRAWNGPLPDGGRLATVRTWGTLRSAKRWLAGDGARPAATGRRARTARPPP